MRPFQILLVLYAVLGLVALALMLRGERRYFFQRAKGSAWLWVRLATVPIALATAALIILPARATSGMEGLVVVYVLLFTAGPAFWFGAHWLVGRLVRPALTFGESARIAVSPIILGVVWAWLGHALQPIAFSMLRSMGLA